MRSLSFLVEAAGMGKLAELIPYRAPILMGMSRPLRQLADLSQELAVKVFYLEQQYLLFIKYGSEFSRGSAIRQIDDLLRLAVNDTKLLPEVRAEVCKDMVGRRKVLIDGWDGAERHAAELAQDAKRSAAIDRAIKKASMPSDDGLLDVARSVETLVNSVIRNRIGSKSDESLLLYLRTVLPTDGQAWKAIYRKLAAFKKAAHKTPQDYVQFRKQFRGEASALKGLLQEQWFWKSQAWRQREGALLRDAMATAENLSTLGRQWHAIILKEPLRDIRRGAEIYDGAILLVRPTTPPGSFEAIPHLLIQIKAEKDISVLGQIARDRARELREAGQFTLTSSDGLTTFTVRPPLGDTKRIVCTPAVADAARVADLPPGVNVIHDISMLDADQLDDVAYRLLEYFTVSLP